MSEIVSGLCSPTPRQFRYFLYFCELQSPNFKKLDQMPTSEMTAGDIDECVSSCALSPHWSERAMKELNETPDTVRESLAALRKLIAGEIELNANPDDRFLIRFLRAKKYDTAKSFSMIQRYYTMKYESPELFVIPRPSEKLHMLEMQAQTMFEDRDQNGSRVYIFRVDKCDISRVSIEDVFSTNVLALEHIVQEPETQIAGLTVLVDMNGFSLQQHAKFLSPYYARRTVEVVQETFPLRFKGFHVLNQPFYFDAVFAVLKPFLKEKIRKRIYLHGKDISSLHSYVNPDILPVEYGGTKGSFDNTWWRQSLLDHEEAFIEQERYGYNLSGRKPLKRNKELDEKVEIKISGRQHDISQYD